MDASSPGSATDAVSGIGQGAAQPAPRRRVSIFTRLAYGLGSVANGIRNGGFSYLLLLFYSQVIGLDARLVGLAITIGLVVDALTDTGIGYWSDNLRTRWGRRHPLMYLAALPTGLGYFLIWNPPTGWSQLALFWYVLLLTLFVRFASSLFEVPNAALAAELTDDYVERSSLISLQQYFGWTGGTLMAVATFGLIFPAFATAQIPNGQFNREAYALYGIIASAVILAAMMVATLGTHNQIRHLKPPPPKRPMTLRRIFAEMFETLGNRSFLALFLVSAFGLVASGVSTALTFYINSFFWGFSSQQIALLTASVLISAVIGGLLAPWASRTIGKRRGAFIIGMTAFLGAPLPIVLRLAGILPAGNDGQVFWFVFAVQTFDVGLIIAFQILAASMIADLVEPAELKTGRRSEGLFSASTSFLGKLVQGIGVTIASFVLTFAGIKAGADPSQVPPEAIWRLGAFYVPTVLTLWMAMMATLTFYKLDRSDHEATLRALAARRAAPAE
jgi:GPH family glycoside/pentoside/hexuronide:cation symporter